MAAKVYGVGVGPGDPELLTMKAHRLIKSAPVIAYPAATGVPSFARSIVADVIAPNTIEIAIEMPMVASRFPAQAIYDQAAQDVKAHIDAGKDVVVLCEGDPLFYGSFMYLFGRLAEAVDIDVVPGVSSINACAAAAGFGLAARNDQLTVLTGPMDEAQLLEGLKSSQSAVVMKVSRHFEKIRAAIVQAGLLDCATYVERGSLETQKVTPLADLNEAFSAPYFSMILVHSRGHAWSLDA